MAIIKKEATQQTDGGGKPTITTTIEGENKISSLTPAPDFSGFYNIIKDKFQNNGFIKDIEYNGVKYSCLANKSNLKSGGGLNTYGLRGRSGKYYSLLPASGLSVPNCTAWAFARIFELMVATGYACKDQNEFNEQNKDGKLIYLTSTTGMNSATSIDSKNIRYSYGLLKTVLDCGDGRQFIDRWPGVVASSGKDLTLMNKWRAKGWAYNATTPRPGCIVAWRNKYGSYWNVPGKSGQESGFPGHVAVVEKVLNAGTEKESIIVSESNYSGGGTAWDYIVRMYEIKKKNDYGMGDYGLYQLQCLGFGYCPACDSVSSMPPGNPSGVTGVSQSYQYVITPSSTSYDSPAYNDINERSYKGLDGKPLYNVKNGARIQLTWGCYQNPDGSGTFYQKQGVICNVIELHDTAKYVFPYEVGAIDVGTGKMTTWGYVQRTDFIKIDPDVPNDPEESQSN